ALPDAPVATGCRKRGPAQLEREHAGPRLDADRPRSAARGDVAACADEARAGRREHVGRPLGRVSLADAPEVETDTAGKRDPAALDANRAAAGDGAVALIRTCGRH